MALQLSNDTLGDNLRLLMKWGYFPEMVKGVHYFNGIKLVDWNYFELLETVSK